MCFRKISDYFWLEINLPLELYGNSVLEGNVDKDAKWRYINIVQTRGNDQNKNNCLQWLNKEKLKNDDRCRTLTTGVKIGFECISLRWSPNWAWYSRWSGINSIMPPPNPELWYACVEKQGYFTYSEAWKGRGKKNTQNNGMRVGKEKSYSVRLN